MIRGKAEMKSNPIGNIRKIYSPNPPKLDKRKTRGRGMTDQTPSTFSKDVINIKMGSNGAATASEHTYILVTGANR